MILTVKPKNSKLQKEQAKYCCLSDRAKSK